MRVYFMDDEGRLRPGDDCGLKPADITFAVDARGLLVGRMSLDGNVHALCTYLDGQTRGQGEERIYEAFRVAMGARNPLKEGP